ncbi:hypothetical protein ACKWRH_05095 [Bradyrhizobium sp. Pa8]|uniref:hypothetical protein n=1 Tax=Bradyrhizobium sp. Pa8 TaxID=3386552 RepID=UPI00403FBFA7
MTKGRESALTVESGEDLLSVYEWNTHRAKPSRRGIRTLHCRRSAGSFRRQLVLSRDLDPAAVTVRAPEWAGMSVVDRTARPQWRGPLEAG